ncbi:hypothetical protein APUTEX25_001382, partial [Auxenochlorella protothecoides]
EQASEDDELASLIQGAEDDPEEIQRRLQRAGVPAPPSASTLGDILERRRAGESRPVAVKFRNVDQFDLWIWLELYTAPAPAAVAMVQEVVNSWYLLGRLGAYNASSMHVLYASQYDLSHMRYGEDEEDEEVVGSAPAAMADMADLEVKGNWLRFWVDLGTADELALDILINALRALSLDHLGIKTLVIGGVNEGWPVPDRQLPEITMDPMRVSVPDFMADEEEDGEDEDEDYNYRD